MMRSILLLGWALASAVAAQPYDLAVRNVTLIDGTGSPARAGVTVLVRDGRIAAITRDASTGEAATGVDGTGRFLIPGLIDAHTHPLPAEGSFPQFVHYGVTSILITGGSIASRENLARVRALAEQDASPSPRVFHTSQHVTMEGRHPVKTYPSPNWVEGETVYYMREARDAEGIVEAVADQPIVGIKVTIEDGPEPPFVEMIPVEFVAALVRAAHARGIQVFAHVSSMEGLRVADEAGVDHLVHFVGVDIDWERDEALVERLRTRDLSWITTLMIDKMLFYPAHPEWLAEVEATGLFDTDEIARLRNGRSAEESLAILSDLYELADPTLETVIRPQVEDLRELHRRGFNLVVGTDMGNDFVFPGLSLHEELELLAMGFTPAELIPMATRNAARMLGVDDDLGTLEVGKWADMVLLDENPLEDIRHTRSMRAVFVAGSRVPVDRPLSR
ncbi:MAG: amidohydrolase family protein [Rubricoccaceae bacterium]